MKISLNLKYLHQRKGYDKLYYQRIVPKDLVPHFKKKKITVPLHTTNLQEASQLIEKLAEKHSQLFRQLRGQEPLTDDEFLQAARDMKNTNNWNLNVTDNDALAEGRSKDDIKQERQYLAIAEMAEEGIASAELLLKNYKNLDEKYLEEVWSDFIRIRGSSFDTKELNNIFKTIKLFKKLTSNKPVREYKREDARKFRDYYLENNTKPSTGKRNQTRIQSVFTFAINEYDLDIRNPFSNLDWPKFENEKREPFNSEEIEALASLVWETNDPLRWALAIQIETGMRISEVIGLRNQDVILDGNIPFVSIKPTPSRRLKSKSSERDIPLFGIAMWGATQLKNQCKGDQLFPKYDNGEKFKKDTATNAINKWLKSKGFKKTTHGLRHSLSDRLRDNGCPNEIVEAINGHTNPSMSLKYGTGYKLEAKLEYIKKIALENYSV